MRARSLRFLLFATLALIDVIPRVYADEGFWLFNDPPRKLLKERYSFELTDAWLEKVRHAAVSLNGGGSGCFVSSDGLIMTNYHVAADAVGAIQIDGKYLGRESFLARKREQEVRLPMFAVSILESVEDVTRLVQESVKAEMKPAEAYRARNRAIKKLEMESEQRTGLRSSVIELYEGNAFHLYRYKLYTDVRLVFFPETVMGPVFDLCFLRAYEKGKPARTTAHFHPSSERPLDRELVFAAGNPHATDRRRTVLDLEENYRWTTYDYRRICAFLALLAEYRARDPKHIEETEIPYHRTKEELQAASLTLSLLDPDSELMNQRRARETALRTAIDGNPAARDACKGAWERMADTRKRFHERLKPDFYLYGEAHAFRGSLFSIARFLVRAAEEVEKPAAERLDGFDDYSLRFERRELAESFPVHPEFEILQLADSLNMLVLEKGRDDEMVRKVLAGKSSKERAAELVRNTKLGDPKVRVAILEGKRKAIESSSDSMIALARVVDPLARKVSEEVDGEYTEVIWEERLRLGKAMRILQGEDAYPDSTGTLRLSFGKVTTNLNPEQAKTNLSTLADVYSRAEAEEQDGKFQMPPIWRRQKDKLNLRTTYWLTLDCDSNNGSSGSPIFDRHGKLIGIVSKIPVGSLSQNYQYKDELARVWAISTPAIIEVLRKVYDAGELVEELTGKPGAKAGN